MITLSSVIKTMMSLRSLERLLLLCTTCTCILLLHFPPPHQYTTPCPCLPSSHPWPLLSSSSSSSSPSSSFSFSSAFGLVEGVPGVGPGDAFERPGITEAPGATMANNQLTHLGQVAKHTDNRGDIIRISLGEIPVPAEGAGEGESGEGGGMKGGESRVIVVNLMRTAAGSLRSGDMHNCTQFDVTLAGRVRLHQMDLNSGKEVVTEYNGRNEFIAIPPRVPHLFEFVEESLMIEWWDCDFHAWHYKPYRDAIAKALAQPAG